MFSGHPRTPQSPSQGHPAHELPSKSSTSPKPNSLPTPAHSINGSMPLSTTETTSDLMQVDDTPKKRKRDLEDDGDQVQKKAHVEISRLSIEDLHLDVGEKYLLCRTQHNPPRPALTEDLFTMYGLNDLANSVARASADGKIKGVKLRKTYKNHIKDHGVSGVFDSKKREFDAPESLFMMMMTPGDEFDAQYTRGKEIEKGLAVDDDLLTKAFTMSKGSIPKDVWDSAVLGELGAPVDAAKTAQKSLLPHASGAARVVKPEISRPRRATKKRSYQDSTFEGYGEGFVDDDIPETTLDTGSNDEKTASKKRKKNPENNLSGHKTPGHNTPGRTFQGAPIHRSYGSGMVGA